MSTSSDLTVFWGLVEANFPFAGPRSVLGERLGPGLLTILERGGLLSYVGQAETYPCPRPGGPGCPRQVVHHSDGRITAVCGNDPPECEDIELDVKDIELLGVEPERLCEALRSPFLFGGKPEKVPDMDRVFRAGTFVPTPGVRQAIYLAARCSAEEYNGLLTALRSRHGVEGFALLIPTDRFVSEDTIREASMQGVVVLPLSGLIAMDATGHLVTSTDAIGLFTGIGRTGPGPVPTTDTVFAQAYTRNGWQNLDEAAYRELVEAADQYDIFADEHAKEARKKETSDKPLHRKKPRQNSRNRVQTSHFQMIRKAIETRGYFDPNINGLTDEQVAGKQIFQRARAIFDIKCKGTDGKDTWKLFKTEIVDNHSVYHFQPDPEVSFALIFMPRS